MATISDKLKELGYDDNEEWYDANGNCDEYGCYDAGGHYYADRGADAGDDYRDRVKDNDL